MIGAIIGDIVGSVYEWDNIKTKDFPLFRKDCNFTDDTVMTVAVGEAVRKGGRPEDFIDAMKKWSAFYPYAGYGSRFGNWLFSCDREPYNSWGNGAAMRVSPCAEFIYRNAASQDGPVLQDGPGPHDGPGLQGSPDLEADLHKARTLAIASAAVTHNHPEGLKGAEAAAYSIMLAAQYGPEAAKKRIRRDIPQLFGYDLSKSLDEIRPTYRFNESCRDTVPQAIVAFLESTDFEDAIRNAISLGGDSDTLAAITGGIAEAAYGVPEAIRNLAMGFLDRRLQEALLEYEGAVGV